MKGKSVKDDIKGKNVRGLQPYSEMKPVASASNGGGDIDEGGQGETTTHTLCHRS
jgi:hypothetical protein